MIDYRRRQREEKRGLSSTREKQSQAIANLEGVSDHGTIPLTTQHSEEASAAKPGYFKFSINDAPDAAPTRLKHQPKPDLPTRSSTRARGRVPDCIADAARCPDMQLIGANSLNFPNYEVSANFFQEDQAYHLKTLLPSRQRGRKPNCYQSPVIASDPYTFSTIFSHVENYVSFLQDSFVLVNAKTEKPIPLPIPRYPDLLVRQRHGETCLFSGWILSNAHMDAHMGAPIQEFPHLQAVVYRNVNASLVHPLEGPVAMTTVGSIIVMSLLEILRGTNKADIHLDGVARIFDLNGGIDSFEDFRIKKMLFMIDMLNATTTYHTSRFTVTGPPNLRTASIPYPEDFYFPSSPLMVSGCFENLRLHNPRFASPEMIQLLQDAFSATEQLQRSPDSRSLSLFPTRSDMLWNPLTTIDIYQSDPDTLIGRAVQLAARIHYRVITLRVPYHNPANDEDYTALLQILRFVNLGAWRGLPYIYLWVLLTSHAASIHRSPSGRAFLASELCRVGLSVGLCDEYEDFMQNLCNFLWLRRTVEQVQAQKEDAAAAVIDPALLGLGEDLMGKVLGLS
ncbi:hypothetical protein BU16DRAFT_614357 [Lophium mytilinum]|uniref:Uncharacterized protein n=1 Tax=Lophium mytilinum TaxID=390894 RepID=A0A6A6R8B1_9PEZI|nr:hypothetical protein BU16DRAFT_614357 [Lophium mytilinum]